MRKSVLLCIGMVCYAQAAWSSPAPAFMASYVPDARAVGEARLSILIWDVYDATLYAPAGRWQASCPFSLSLAYLRDLSGSEIADRSVEEIRKQGFSDEIRLAAWHKQMRDIFPDVHKGSSLTGVCMADGTTLFIRNGKEIGKIRDKEFSKRFFDIWLGERTSEPALRRQLLGGLS
jgi:hypothetical protein